MPVKSLQLENIHFVCLCTFNIFLKNVIAYSFDSVYFFKALRPMNKWFLNFIFTILEFKVQKQNLLSLATKDMHMSTVTSSRVFHPNHLSC